MRRWIPHGTFYQLCLFAVLALLIAACSNDGTSPNGTDGSPGSTTTNEGGPDGGTQTTNGQGSGTTTSGGTGTTSDDENGTGTTDGGTGTTDGGTATTDPGTVTTTSSGGATTTSAGASTTVTAAPSGDGEIGYMGCSMSTDAVIGYQQVGGTSLWTAGEGDYSGGALDLWANRVGANQMWSKFQQKLDANPGTTSLWWELCTTDAGRGDNLEMGLAVLGEIEARLGGRTIYISAQPDYDGHVCPTSGPDGPQQMQALASQLVATGRVLAGPFQGPLTEPQTRDLCHASESGRLILGNQLLAFFGG